LPVPPVFFPNPISRLYCLLWLARKALSGPKGEGAARGFSGPRAPLGELRDAPQQPRQRILIVIPRLAKKKRLGDFSSGEEVGLPLLLPSQIIIALFVPRTQPQSLPGKRCFNWEIAQGTVAYRPFGQAPRRLRPAPHRGSRRRRLEERRSVMVRRSAKKPSSKANVKRARR
jgi:hypothetical protein